MRWVVVVSAALVSLTAAVADDEKDRAMDLVDKCIYQLDEDMLTIYTAQTVGPGIPWNEAIERPTEFKTTARGATFAYKRMEK